MILLIDNYDSFSYNLYQAVGQVNPDIKVVRNDELTVEEIRQMAPEALILSPGPGRPKEAGICEQAAKELAGEFPILGVCLGHQAIYEVFGGTVSYAGRLMHGKQSMAKLDLTCPIFDGLPEEVPVARYHSLAGVKETLARRIESHSTDDGGRNHGSGPQNLSHLRAAVSSGIHSDTGRTEND